MSNIEIYYFTGTGNSLQVAKELQRRIPQAKLIPIMSLLNKEVIEVHGDTVGFIFPLHAFTVPFPVEAFLKKISFKSDPYLFAISTRGGAPCKVFRDINRYLKKQGKKLDANFFIDMPNNYLLSFPLPTSTEINDLEKEMHSRVELIQKIVLHKEKCLEKDPHRNFVLEKILFPLIKLITRGSRYGNLEKKYYSDSKCTGCKTCEKVCPSGKITVIDGKPVWQNDIPCTFCFACIHYCPAQAIQVKKSKTAEKGRYSHPQITAAEIAGQKIIE